MSFEIRDKDLAGRIGRLTTKSGTLETPAFFPVVNPFRKAASLAPEEIREIGFTQVITNSFIIQQRLGDKAGDVHSLLGFNGVVMTDSGAYQLLMYGGKRIRIDPIEIVKYQTKLSSDIAVIADIPTRSDSTYEDALKSVEETLRRAELVAGLVRESAVKQGMIWVLPVQGGVYKDLVAISAERSSRIPGYGMYAIGSPVTVLEKYEFWRIVDMVATAKMRLPPDKPVHLFGGGHPLIIPLMIALGIDSFDSASYILYARDGRYMTEHRTYRIDELDYLPCECPVCSRFTARELRSLDEADRVKLIAKHNLYVIRREIGRAKQAIREGRLWELIEERARTHPSVREALTHLIRYVSWIERLDPTIKGRAKGIFLYDETSYYRPELVRHRKRVNSFIERRLGDAGTKYVVIVPGNPSVKPLHESPTFKHALKLIKERVRARLEGSVVLIYLPFYNIVPYDIDQTYPYSQFEMSVSRLTLTEIYRRLCLSLNSVIRKALRAGKKVILIRSREIKEFCPAVTTLCRIVGEGLKCVDIL